MSAKQQQIPVTVMPDTVFFVDIEHVEWRTHYQNALAVGIEGEKAKQLADIQTIAARGNN